MLKFTKLLIFLAAEITLIFAFINFSEASSLASTIVFPPIFAITLYFFVITLFEVEREGLVNRDFAFALLLASVALISTGAGFHYAANDINDVFIPEQYISGDFVTQVLDRVDYLDETFSHTLMFVGFAGIIIASLSWWYFERFKALSGKIDINLASGPIDYFIVVFIGSLCGAAASLLSIEAQILPYGIASLAISSVLFVIRFRKIKITPQGKDIVMFALTFIASYFAVSTAYYFMTATSAILFTRL